MEQEPVTEGVAELVGREREQAALARFVERASEGPGALLIEGEPGIGKTTLWFEGVRTAERRGRHVLQARPAEAETDLSYAALADLVGAVVDDFAAALPALQRRALEVALRRREADTASDPLTTASAFVGVLRALAAQQPVVVAVDDAQWLDPASRRALEFAVRRLPPRVDLLVARRSEAGAAPPLGLGRALRPEALERVVLGPLTLAALHHVIVGELQLRLARPVLVRIESASGGNPFFALELARSLEAGGVRDLGEPLRVPQSLRQLVLARVGELSAPAREAALVVSALSHPTAALLAAAFAGEGDVETAVLEAEDRDVLVRDRERLRFSHPLLAAAVYGAASAATKRQLHRRLADVVADPEERAYHLARSVTAPDGAVAAELEAAADLAERRGAPDAAADLFEAAWRLTPEGQPEDVARRRLRGADVLSIAGDLDGARTVALAALADATTGPLRARALLRLGMLASYTETMTARLAYHERALAEAGSDDALRTEILLLLFEEIATDAARAFERADEAIELLRRRDRGTLLARALMNKFFAGGVLGRGEHRALLDEAFELERQSSNSYSLYPLLWFQFVDDLPAARAEYEKLDERSRQLGDELGRAELVECIAMAEFYAGNWDEAEARLEDSCATLEQLEVKGPLVASFADRSRIDAHRGRFERARSTLHRFLGELEPGETLWRAVCRSALGVVEFYDGRDDAAEEAWSQMFEESELIGWKDFLEDRSEPDRVEALLSLGDLEGARRVLAHLEWRGQTLRRPWIDAALPRARALIRAAAGDVEGALRDLETAPVDMRLPFERGRLLLVKGRLERRTNRRSAARESLTEALAVFDRLGSPPWTARAGAELERLGLRHRRSDELTATERRIAELAATGLTNRRVAEAAFVSPKTVEANLARVYRKLGIRSRAELGARMAAEARDAAEQP